MFSNQILTVRNGKMIFTKGQQEIKLGDITLKKVSRYKCPLVTEETQDFEFTNGLFDADPGKYLIEYDRKP